MTISDYRKAFEGLVTDLETKLATRDQIDIQRENIDEEIAQLRDAIPGMAKLAGIDNVYEERPDLFAEFLDPDIGITDAVREVLQGAYDYVSAVEVKKRLERKGFDVKKYRNALAVIHQILRRLDGKEAESRTVEGKTSYRWKRELKVPTRFFGGGLPTS